MSLAAYMGKKRHVCHQPVLSVIMSVPVIGQRGRGIAGLCRVISSAVLSNNGSHAARKGIPHGP